MLGVRYVVRKEEEHLYPFIVLSIPTGISKKDTEKVSQCAQKMLQFVKYANHPQQAAHVILKFVMLQFKNVLRAVHVSPNFFRSQVAKNALVLSCTLLFPVNVMQSLYL